MGRTAHSAPRRPAEPGAGSGARAGRSRRRPSGKAVVFAAVGVTIVAVLAWALLGSRLLVVRSVKVTGGGQAVPAAQVLAAARVRYGTPLIRVDTGTIARRVEAIRQVQSVQVSKSWPSTVVITVQPRTPVFAVPVPNGYALVDRFGVSIREVAAQPAGLPLLSVVGTGTVLRGDPAVRAAAVVLTELPPQVARKVRDVTATSPSAVSVTLADRAVVIWGSTAGAKEKAKELTVLMHRHARSYDVSDPGSPMVSG